MARKTRQQKIIADLRRQLQTQSPTPVAPTVQTASATISLPATPLPVVTTTKLDHSKLGRDLAKVGLLVGSAVVIELVATLTISHGYLVPWGIF